MARSLFTYLHKVISMRMLYLKFLTVGRTESALVQLRRRFRRMNMKPKLGSVSWSRSERGDDARDFNNHLNDAVLGGGPRQVDFTIRMAEFP
jgi:hypothetical protein